MYGIDGEQDLTEQTLDHLTGYDGASPVRIGNGAFDQRQNDVYGAVLDSVYLHTKHGGHLPQRLWPVLEDQVEARSPSGSEPDQGIWEARGEPQALRLLEADVLGRAGPRRAAGARSTASRSSPSEWQPGRRRDPAPTSSSTACATGVFRQHYDTDALDASTLLIPLVRFLPADDERVRDTVLAIARRPDRARPRAALPGRRDRRRPARRGGHVPDLLVLARLARCSEIGERRRAQALLREAAHATPRRCCCSPRSSTPTAAATSATTPRRSPTSRSSTPSCT